MTKKKHPADITQATYTPEYRAEAVKLALASVTISEAARNLGISEKTLHRWVSAERKAGASGTTVDAMKTANAEIARLKRELARSQQERDFLLEAGAFFRRNPK